MPKISGKSRFTSKISRLWSQVCPGQNHIHPGPRMNVPMMIISTHSTMKPKHEGAEWRNLRCFQV